MANNALIKITAEWRENGVAIVAKNRARRVMLAKSGRGTTSGRDPRGVRSAG